MSKPFYNSIHTYIENDYEKFASYDRFAFMEEIMKPLLLKGGRFLDIGCAKGEMIYSLKKRYENVDFTGVDPSEELLELARSYEDLKAVKFLKSGITDLPFQEEFDFCLASGVVTIFDDLMEPFEGMLRVLKPGGTAFVFSGFNSNDMDVIVRYRNNAIGSKEWESGLNMFSLITVEHILQGMACNVKWHPFQIKVDLKPAENPIKSYTLNTEEMGKVLLNGANIRREFFLLQFEKPEK